MHTDAERKYAAKATRIRRASRGSKLPYSIAYGYPKEKCAIYNITKGC